MDKKWVTFYCSSSISNFYDKLRHRFELLDWHWWSNRHNKNVFFGMYHIGDYIRLFWHRGPRVVVWCGSDILSLNKSIFRRLVASVKAKHYCENEVEAVSLAKMGIKAKVQPMCFERIDDLHVTYKHTNEPHVFLCSHPGSNEAYGIPLMEGIASAIPEVTFHIYGVSGYSRDNIVYHGQVSNERFNKEIRKYQAGLRLNEFDGFAEVLAKSILLGQYPISTIYYPHIDHAKDTTTLINLLRDLKNKKEPNEKARNYWLNELSKNPFI